MCAHQHRWRRQLCDHGTVERVVRGRHCLCEPAEARTALPAWECRQGRMQRCQCASTGSAAGQMPSGPAINAVVQLTRSCPSRMGASDALLARQPSGPEKVQALAKGHERSLWSDRKVAGKRQRWGRGWFASAPRRFRWQLLCLPSMVPASQCLLARLTATDWQR